MNRYVCVCGLALGLLFLFWAPQVRADGSDSFVFSESVFGVTTTYT